MQTFLPYPDFQQSAKVLDTRRLGKQRVECLQILKALKIGPTITSLGTYRRKTPWYNHPATQMWKGYERFLYHHYMACIVAEWLRRGYTDTTYEKARQLTNLWHQLTPPYWLGYEPFHSAHRAILLAKDPQHYSQFGWTEQPAKKDKKGSYPYIWPTKLPADVVAQLKKKE